MELLDRRQVGRFIAGSVAMTAIASTQLAQASQRNRIANRIDAAFDRAKSSENALTAFMKMMPKGADIHHHLEGSGYDQDILHAAITARLNYDTAAHKFTRQSGAAIVPASELLSNDALFVSFRDHFSILGKGQSRSAGREHFFSIFGRVQSSEIALRTLLEASLKRAAEQNILYIETIAPVVPWSLLTKAASKITNFSIDDLDTAFAQLEPWLTSVEFKQGVNAHVASILPSGPQPCICRLIGYSLRFFSLETFFAHTASNFAAVKSNPYVVGYNIVGPEDGPIANADFAAHMQIIGYLSQKCGIGNIALHAGELTPSEVSPEVLRDRILDSIEIGGAKRIGHGVSLAWEGDESKTLGLMKSRQVAVEICLSSNEIILNVDGGSHPIRTYLNNGVPLVIGTDDEGISRSPLTNEFVKAISRYDLRYDDVLRLCRNSLEYAFIGGASLFSDYDKNEVRDEFKNALKSPGALNTTQKALVDANPKLGLQLDFERRLQAFEDKILLSGA